MSQEPKAIIRRYYEELWNRWDLAVANELVAPNVQFRGSLGIAVQGLDGFLGYVERVRQAFPDFQNAIQELIAEGDTVVARLTYSGTHRGELFGVPATGKRVTYEGVAIVHLRDGKILEGWVLGDTFALRQQVGALFPPPGLLLQPPRPDSDLARAGLRGGELLLAVDDRPIRDNSDVQAVLREHTPGEDVRLRVQRPGEEPTEVRVRQAGDSPR